MFRVSFKPIFRWQIRMYWKTSKQIEIGMPIENSVDLLSVALLSPTLFNIFLERIMCEALDDHEGSFSIGGRLICKCRRGRRSWRPGRPSRYKHHKIQNGDRSRQDKSDDKQPKWLPKRDQDEKKSQRLEEVESFKYLGTIISNEGSNPEILSRIAQIAAALSKLKIIWRDKNISLASKVKLMRTLILSTFLYACESWTLTAEIERRIQALEMRCYRRLLNISYKNHVTNEEVRNRIQNAIGVHDDLLTMVKKRKLKWWGHILRSSGMAKTVLQGKVKGARRRGRQKKRWEGNIKEWTGMEFRDSLRATEDREGWKGIVATSSVVPRRHPSLRDWDEIVTHICFRSGADVLNGDVSVKNVSIILLQLCPNIIHRSIPHWNSARSLQPNIKNRQNCSFRHQKSVAFESST